MPVRWWCCLSSPPADAAETSAPPPAGGGWQQHIDPATGRVYFANDARKVTAWELPQGERLANVPPPPPPRPSAMPPPRPSAMPPRASAAMPPRPPPMRPAMPPGLPPTVRQDLPPFAQQPQVTVHPTPLRQGDAARRAVSWTTAAETMLGAERSDDGGGGGLPPPTEMPMPPAPHELTTPRPTVSAPSPLAPSPAPSPANDGPPRPKPTRPPPPQGIKPYGRGAEPPEISPALMHLIVAGAKRRERDSDDETPRSPATTPKHKDDPVLRRLDEAAGHASVWRKSRFGQAAMPKDELADSWAVAKLEELQATQSRRVHQVEDDEPPLRDRIGAIRKQNRAPTSEDVMAVPALPYVRSAWDSSNRWLAGDIGTPTSHALSPPRGTPASPLAHPLPSSPMAHGIPVEADMQLRAAETRAQALQRYIEELHVDLEGARLESAATAGRLADRERKMEVLAEEVRLERKQRERLAARADGQRDLLEDLLIERDRARYEHGKARRALEEVATGHNGKSGVVRGELLRLLADSMEREEALQKAAHDARTTRDVQNAEAAMHRALLPAPRAVQMPAGARERREWAALKIQGAYRAWSVAKVLRVL